MKYMLLVHHDQEAFAKRPEAERQSLLQESVQLANQLHANGKYFGAAPLHPSSETTCVQVRNGKRLVTGTVRLRKRVNRSAGTFWSMPKIATKQSILPAEFRERGSEPSKFVL